VALLLPKSVFIHIPKTGGMWVRQAIINAGIPAREKCCKWHEGTNAEWGLGKNGERLPNPHVCLHAAAHDIDPQGRFTFAFVRHPLDFYISYWCFKKRSGWDMGNGIDRNVCHETFDGFVRDCLRIMPSGKGLATYTYEWFLDEAGWTLDFVGKQESLADDLVRALRLAGETFDEEALRRTPRVNECPTDGFDKPTFSPELLTLVLEKEYKTTKRFGYAAFPKAGQTSGLPRSSVAKTGVFIGRFQPFHEGHKRCVEKILLECDRCIILIRDTDVSDKNPFDLPKRIALIRACFPHEKRVLIRSIEDPGCDLTVYIGRDVGYDLIRLDSATEAISATNLRGELYGGDRQAGLRQRLSVRSETPAPDASAPMLFPVLWLTGNTGAGKTTLAQGIERHFNTCAGSSDPLSRRVLVLDGDEMRETISTGESMSAADRRTHNMRVARLARLMQRKGFVVVVAVIAPFASVRAEVDRICAPLWIHVKRRCPEAPDQPYEVPLNASHAIDNDALTKAEALQSFLSFVEGVRTGEGMKPIRSQAYHMFHEGCANK